MLFRSKDARWLIDSGRIGVNGFLNAAEEAGSKQIERDATIMFAGSTHFGIAFYLAHRRINPADIEPILTACALHIRHYAPNHGMGDHYLKDTGEMVEQAVRFAEQDPIKWIIEYRRLAGPLISIDETSFFAALSAHIIFAINRLPQSN